MERPDLAFSPIFFLLLLLLSPRSISLSNADEDFTVSSHPAKLVLPPGRLVVGSPGSKPASAVACNRVHILGFSRLHSLRKYANSLKIRASFVVEESGIRVPAFEVCFHRNASVGVGMCSASGWEKITKGSWVRTMSPFDVRILDVRMPKAASSKLIEVSTEEEFLFHRVVFLVVGLVLMVLAHVLSKSVVFYYGSAMFVGILLVILVVLFQGMKLLPTGRKSSFAIFMYSSFIGVITFLSRYLSGLLRSLLVEFGISEDMYNPILMLLICCLFLIGASLGFWSVRKLVLVDGSVDKSIAYFVEYTILGFGSVMIFESSLDSLLVVEALALGVVLSLITRRMRKAKFVRRLCRRISKYAHSLSQYSPSTYGDSKYQSSTTRMELRSLNSQAWATPTPAYCSSDAKGSAQRSFQKPSVQDVCYSTFHKTPDRKKFSKEEWKEFTRASTKEAMNELCLSPDFGRWAAENADRISVSPPSGSGNSDHVRRRFYLF